MKKLHIVYSHELKALHEKGWKLIEKGQVDKALLLWEKEFTEAGHIYPPSLPDIVQLYTQLGQYEQAEIYLNLLEQVNEFEEGDWLASILISRMLLSYHQGDSAAARRYIRQLEVLDLEEEDRALLRQLEESIGDSSGQSYEKLVTQVMMDEIMGLALMELVEELSRKELPLNPSIGRGLRNWPVHWIDGACEVLGVEGLPRRPQREKQIINHLSDPDLLEELCEEHLDEDEFQLLRYIIGKGGWSRFQAISRLFGGLTGENYFWPEDGPCTSVGTLWSLGLVMIGQTVIDGRKTRIATIPAELRAPLQDILEKRE